MPIIKSAIKRMKQTAKRKDRNQETKRDFRGAIKNFLAKPTASGLKEAQSGLDTAVKKNVLNKNTASRKKSQLSRIAKDAGVKVEASKKTPAVKKPAAAKAPAKKAPAKKPAIKAPATKKPAAKKTTK